MRTQAQPVCPICETRGATLYTGLSDGLYDAAGLWQMRQCQAPHCGALFLDPAPHPEDLALAYADYYTHSASGDAPAGFRSNVRDAFAARTLGYEPAHNLGERLASLLYITSPRRSEWALYKRFYLPWSNAGRLLEVGCGSGGQLAIMARAGWETTGLDFDPRAVLAARQRGLNVNVGDVRDAGFGVGQFDAIVMTHVIEHVIDPVGVLAECRRILNPQGTVVVITPNTVSLGHRVYGRNWRGLEPPRHLTVFSPAALRLAFEKAGIETSRVIYSARDAANLFLSSERLRDRGEQRRIAHPSESELPPLRLRVLENVERLACWLGFAWGEEQIVLGHPKAAERPPSSTST